MHIIWTKSACKAVSGHPLTAANQDRPRAILSRICGARIDFSSISVLLRQYRSIKAPHSPSSSKQPLSEGLLAKPGGLSNERNFSLISSKAQKSIIIALFACKERSSLHRWQLAKVHADPRFARGFQNSERVLFHHRIAQAASSSHTNHENENSR
jgi:hypothetical protein